MKAFLLAILLAASSAVFANANANRTFKDYNCGNFQMSTAASAELGENVEVTWAESSSTEFIGKMRVVRVFEQGQGYNWFSPPSFDALEDVNETLEMTVTAGNHLPVLVGPVAYSPLNAMSWYYQRLRPYNGRFLFAVTRLHGDGVVVAFDYVCNGEVREVRFPVIINK